MERSLFSAVLVVVLNAALFVQVGNAQGSKITIAAGTPEDQALQAITNEQDPQKQLAMYEDFVQKFPSNPAAVAYGNWQIALHYQTAGDAGKALEYGDKALAGAPQNLDILSMQVNTAQQLKDNSKVVDYAARGAEAYKASTSDADKEAAENSYQFMESAAFNAIVAESDANKRMAEIERFTPAFPSSKFADQVTSYALLSLSQLNDMPRLTAYGEKILATNPDSLPTLVMLANAYVNDSRPGSTAKAITYAQKVIASAKANDPDADRSRKLSAGSAHSTLGFAYMKQDKTAASIPELKAAIALLKGLDDQSYALAAYRLGFAYAKLRQLSEAREVLTGAAKIPGPMQATVQDLLTKVNAARAGGK